MTFQEIREEADRLRVVPLEAVLQLIGAQPDRRDRAKWHTARGVLSVTGMKFMNWKQGMGGGGAIDLVMHLNGLGFQAALGWLRHHFPSTGLPALPPPSSPPRLKLPPPEPEQSGRVRRYLVQDRSLPAALLQPLLDSGRLYADHRGNAVFLLLGRDNSPVGAELRGTATTSWRGMAPGSRKDLGYFSLPAPHATTVILSESAIDVISCFALHPGRLCISTSGARPNPAWLPSLLRQGYEVYCGFDTDPTGEQMAQALIRLYPGVKRLRPPQHDWNDALRLRSKHPPLALPT